jgi:hypothetical protein
VGAEDSEAKEDADGEAEVLDELVGYGDTVADTLPVAVTDADADADADADEEAEEDGV